MVIVRFVRGAVSKIKHGGESIGQRDRAVFHEVAAARALLGMEYVTPL